jgi:glycosyltransferase involved in cell wall biosynthesis
LPEVAGNAALYFDPDDELSLRNATEKIISDGQLRNELICKGSERFTDFSWDKTARETEAVYQSML